MVPVRMVNRSAAPPALVAIVASSAWRRRHFFQFALLGGEHVAAWVRARAISEGLKREAYKSRRGAP